MAPGNPVTGFLAMNWTRFPSLIIIAVGIALAVVTWRRHPQASLLSLIAFVVFLLDAVLSGVLDWYVFDSGLYGGALEQWAVTISVGNGFFTILNTLAWIPLLIALFGRRAQAPAWAQDDPDRFRRLFAEPAAPPRRSGPPSEDIQR
jgi:hypothetical protein